MELRKALAEAQEAEAAPVPEKPAAEPEVSAAAAALRAPQNAKGDVLAVARVAGRGGRLRLHASETTSVGSQA